MSGGGRALSGSIWQPLDPCQHLPSLLITLIPLKSSTILSGGEGGIRTHDTLASITVFKTASLNHSDTSPCSLLYLKIGSIINVLRRFFLPNFLRKIFVCYVLFVFVVVYEYGVTNRRNKIPPRYSRFYWPIYHAQKSGN